LVVDWRGGLDRGEGGEERPGQGDERIERLIEEKEKGEAERRKRRVAGRGC
jgi:hypothetical protein